MLIEEHRKALEEHEKNITRCIDNGIWENQRNLAYNVSQASVEMLSIFLLKIKAVPVSTNFDHRIFKHSKSIKERLPMDFPEKTKILGLMRTLEEKRILLCYGKRKPEKEAAEMLGAYSEFKDIIGGMIGEPHEK